MVDAYTGEVLGEANQGVRTFFRTVTEWHRWFGAKPDKRSTPRAITGAANLAFLGLVISGLYLWMPRQWTWRHVQPVLWFRGRLTGKARDFNWHNVIGFWSAVPLFFIVISGAVMSYPWANNLIYTLTGDKPPRRRPASIAQWFRFERPCPHQRSQRSMVSGPDSCTRVADGRCSIT